MNLIADTKIDQKVPGVHLRNINIAGKMYSLNIHEGSTNDERLWLSFKCDDASELWMIIDKEINIYRDSDPLHHDRGEREAFLSVDGSPHKWLKWDECAGEPNAREHGIEFGCPPKEGN